MTIKNAYTIALEEARKQYHNSELQACIDIGDRFAFSVSFEGRSIKGASLITVDKNSSELGFLILPDETNFELLRKGTEIDISDLKDM